MKPWAGHTVDVVIEHTPRGVKEVVRFLEGVPTVDEGIDLFMASTLKLGRMLTGVDHLPRRPRRNSHRRDR